MSLLCTRKLHESRFEKTAKLMRAPEPTYNNQYKNGVRTKSLDLEMNDRLSPTLLCLACNELSVMDYRIKSGVSGKN